MQSGDLDAAHFNDIALDRTRRRAGALAGHEPTTDKYFSVLKSKNIYKYITLQFVLLRVFLLTLRVKTVCTGEEEVFIPLHCGCGVVCI